LIPCHATGATPLTTGRVPHWRLTDGCWCVMPPQLNGRRRRWVWSECLSGEAGPDLLDEIQGVRDMAPPSSAEEVKVRGGDGSTAGS
jgi:hypothetical protein